MSVVTVYNLAVQPHANTAVTYYAAVPGTGGTAAGAQNSGNGADGLPGIFRTTWTVATTAISGGASYSLLSSSITPSATFTHSMWVRSSVAQTVALTVDYRDATNTTVNTATGASVALTANVWARVSVTATAGVAVDRGFITAAATTGGVNWANGNTFDITQVMTTTGSTLVSYFDGSYPSGAGIAYAWTGAAQASTSTSTTYSPVLTLTALVPGTGNPCDSVRVQVTDLPNSTCNITIWRTADGKRAPVRGYRKVNVVGSDSTTDYEAPLGRNVTYDLEVLSGVAFGGPSATASIVVNAATGWIQDPLDPSSAVALQGTDTGSTGVVTLRFDALKKFEMAASINLVEILGSTDPVALLGNRMALRGLSFAMMTNAANSSGALRALIKQTPLLLIRPLPAWAAALPGLCYTAAPAPVELPINEAWGGTAIEFTFETPLVAAPIMNLVIPVFTYQNWNDLWTTYQQAQTTLNGKTYLQVKQNPATG